MFFKRNAVRRPSDAYNWGADVYTDSALRDELHGPWSEVNTTHMYTSARSRSTIKRVRVLTERNFRAVKLERTEIPIVVDIFSSHRRHPNNGLCTLRFYSSETRWKCLENCLSAQTRFRVARTYAMSTTINSCNILYNREDFTRAARFDFRTILGRRCNCAAFVAYRLGPQQAENVLGRKRGHLNESILGGMCARCLFVYNDITFLLYTFDRYTQYFM